MIEETFEKKPDGLISLEDFVALFSDLLHNARIYPESHKYMVSLYDQFCSRIKEIIGSKSKIIFRIIEGHLYYNNFRIDISDSDNGRINVIMKIMRKMSIKGITISRDVEMGEVKAFIEICLAALHEDRTTDISARWNRIKNIRIENDFPKNERSEKKLSGGGALNQKNQGALGGKNAVGGAIGDVLQRLEKIESTRKRNAGERILDLITDAKKYQYAILLLKSLKDYDPYTFNHSINVSVISTALATRLGWNHKERDKLGIASLLHDIGKVHIPRKILHKEGKLTPTEWKYIKKHPIDGMNILKDENADILIQRAAYEHHIRFDKKGYPSVKDDYRMLDASHIIQIADSYDALTTKRPYRKQLNPFEAVSFMQKKRGTEFHPRFIDMFMTILGNVPIGCIVRLDSGETAVVVEASQNIDALPTVRVIKDPMGKKIEGGRIIDLNEKDGEAGSFLRSIRNVVDDPTRDIDIGEYTMGRK